MTHFMIDIETTGLNPGVNHITSCAIVPFDLETGLYGEKFFHERFDIDLINRVWNADTAEFRKLENIGEMEKNLPKQQTLLKSLETIKLFLSLESKGFHDVVVWAKPTHFDIAFLESYHRQQEITIPWSHRNVRDLATYLMAAGHNLADLYEEIKLTGDAHNALHDCHYQILLANLGYRSLEKNKKLAG